MNLKEQCEKDGISITEGKKKYGLTHWNQTVPPIDVVGDAMDSIEDKETVAVTADSATEILKKSQDVMKKLMMDGVTAKKALIGIRVIGKKSKYYEDKEILETLVD